MKATIKDSGGRPLGRRVLHAIHDGMFEKLVSESNTPIRLKYMGRVNIDLDGNPEYDVFIEHGDTFTLHPARDMRQKPSVSLRIGSKMEHFNDVLPANLIQLLMGSQWPKNKHADLTNILYLTGRKNTRKQLVEVARITKTSVTEPVLKWFVVPPCTLYFDKATKQHFLEYDLKRPLETVMSKVKVAKLKRLLVETAADEAKAAAEKSLRDPVRAPRARKEPETPLAPAIPSTDKAGADLASGGSRKAIPVTHPAVGAGTTVKPVREGADAKGFGFIAALPVSAQPTTVWATYGATMTAVRAAAEIAFRSIPHTTSNELDKAGGEYTIYRVVNRSPMLSGFGSKNLKQIPVAELVEKATRIRSRTLIKPVEDDVNDYDPRTTIDNHDVFKELAVSWSSFDIPKVRITLAQLFKRGMFDSNLDPRVTTKGLVFDYPHVAGRKGRDVVYGAVRRVYEWLHNHGVGDLNVVARWKEDKALIDFQFPELTDAQSASIRELMQNPPTLKSPIYTLKGEIHRTFQIDHYDLSTGLVTVYPVRGQHVVEDGTQVLYTSVLRLQK